MPFGHFRIEPPGLGRFLSELRHIGGRVGPVLYRDPMPPVRQGEACELTGIQPDGIAPLFRPGKVAMLGFQEKQNVKMRMPAVIAVPEPPMGDFPGPNMAHSPHSRHEPFSRSKGKKGVQGLLLSRQEIAQAIPEGMAMGEGQEGHRAALSLTEGHCML